MFSKLIYHPIHKDDIKFDALCDGAADIPFPNVVYVEDHMIQICSGITSGRVLNGELYVQRLQKLIYLHLLTASREASMFCIMFEVKNILETFFTNMIRQPSTRIVVFCFN